MLARSVQARAAAAKPLCPSRRSDVSLSTHRTPGRQCAEVYDGAGKQASTECRKRGMGRRRGRPKRATVEGRFDQLTRRHSNGSNAARTRHLGRPARITGLGGEPSFTEAAAIGEAAPIPDLRGVAIKPRGSALGWADRHDSKQRMVGCREYNPVAQGGALDPPPREDPAVTASGDQRRTAGT
jgi:hypothetical protein